MKTNFKQIGIFIGCLVITISAFSQNSKIIHDAEYYILKAQHGEKWAREDADLNKKLAALKKKHGKTPNIVHIMWDDTAVGEIGVPQIQASRGFKTPNMNKFAEEGQYYSRMYTEPSCTPTRAAFQTGRHAVRSGMYTVSFPYEYGGMSEKETTIAEIVASGGAGKLEHFYEAVQAGATILLAASVFHFNMISIPDLKTYLRKKGVDVAGK